MGIKIKQMCANKFQVCGWVTLRLKKSIFLFQWKIIQGSSGFISHNSLKRKHISNGQRSRFWKECHPRSPLQTKPLPEKPPLMKWTGQCNKAWAKHLLADHYYKWTKPEREWEYTLHVRLPFTLFLTFNKAETSFMCEAKRYELTPVSKQRNEKQMKLLSAKVDCF